MPAPVQVLIPPPHVHFLKACFRAARDGRLADMAANPDDATRRREADAYDALLAATHSYTLTPTEPVLRALRELAEVVDADNEHQKVVLEHQALHGLLGQLEVAR